MNNSEIIKLIILKIYEYQEKGECVYNSKIIKSFEDKLSRREVGIGIDLMFDRCIIKSEWHVKNGKYIRLIKLTNMVYEMVENGEIR